MDQQFAVAPSASSETELPVKEPLLSDHNADIAAQSEKCLPKSTTNIPQSRLPPSKFQAAADWFLWEILSIAVAALSVVSIVVVLISFNGKAQPQWPMGITINSILSWLSTIARSSLLVPITKGISQLKWTWFGSVQRLADLQRFDDASRGPWGSLMLLWSLKNGGRVAYFAAIGAVATILMLGMDPFIQQLVVFRTREVPLTNATSSVTRADYFYERPLGRFQTHDVSLGMKAAMYGGIFQSATSQPSFECASGSCTWPLYSSLAVCSLCTDLTPKLTTHCDAENRFCNLTLPYASSPSLRNMAGEVLKANTSIPSVSYSFEGALLNFIGIAGAPGEFQLNSTFKALATECVLVPCVNTYRSSVVEGNYTEEVVASYTNYTGVTSSVSGGMNVTLEPPPHSFPGSSKQYNLDILTIVAISNYLAEFLSGYAYRDPQGSRSFSSDAAQGFWEAESFELPLRNLAAGMTKVIRDSNTTDAKGNQLLPNAEGTVWGNETYIEVHWWWLCLPALLIVLSTVEFVGALVKTRQVAGLRMWRTSSLALLMHGLDKDTLDLARGSMGNVVGEDTKNGNADSQLGLFDASEQIFVRLGTSNEGILQFHGTQE
ncbi:hypothetical protein IFR05_004533 [Cadophora sp. M221]|nr:hypothetical protein IFR05_004533 [Cadophora sp. M221]